MYSCKKYEDYDAGQAIIHLFKPSDQENLESGQRKKQDNSKEQR